MYCHIVDLDGCLANDLDRRVFANGSAEYVDFDDKSFNWDLYFSYDLILNDGVNEMLKRALQLVRLRGTSIIYLTGRPEKTRRATQDWLVKNELNFHSELLMRADDDFSSAFDYKKAAIADHVLPFWQPLIGYSDMPCDIDAYAAHEIPGIIVQAYDPHSI